MDPCDDADASVAADANTAPDAETERMARVFAALSNPVRIEILRHVSRHQHCRCKEITQVLPLAQSTVSQHLKVLVEAELIRCEAVPPSSHYRVNDALLERMSVVTGSFLHACCGKVKCT